MINNSTLTVFEIITLIIGKVTCMKKFKSTTDLKYEEFVLFFLRSETLRPFSLSHDNSPGCRRTSWQTTLKRPFFKAEWRMNVYCTYSVPGIPCCTWYYTNIAEYELLCFSTCTSTCCTVKNIGATYSMFPFSPLLCRIQGYAGIQCRVDFFCRAAFYQRDWTFLLTT